MAYTDYSYTALTQAEFFKAEAELIRFGERLAHSLGARYLKDTLLAIDAIFALTGSTKEMRIRASVCKGKNFGLPTKA